MLPDEIAGTGGKSAAYEIYREGSDHFPSTIAMKQPFLATSQLVYVVKITP